jgi:hypothetical protein
MSMRSSHPGWTEIGNQIQLMSVPTASTSPIRRSERRTRGARGPAADAARTCTSASEKPAAKMNDGATSPFT